MARRFVTPYSALLTLTPLVVSLAPAAHAQKRARRQADDLPSRTAAPRPNATIANPKLRYGAAPLPSGSGPRTAFVDPADGEVYIAPEALRPLSIDSTADLKSRAIVLIRRDSGASVVLEGRKGPVGRSGLFISARQAVKELGGRFDWDPDTGIATIRAVLQEAVLENGVVTVKASLPITPTVGTDPETGRVTLDFPGATIGELPRALDLQSDLVKSARAVQNDENTARITVEVNRLAPFKWVANPAGTRIQFGPNVIAPAAVATTPAPAAIRTVRGAPALVRTLKFAAMGDDRARLSVAANRLPVVRPVPGTNRFVLDFGNAALAQQSVDGFESGASPLVKSVQITPQPGVAARVVLELAQAARFAMRLNPRGGLLVDLVAAGAKETMPLLGRTIVVDPGHGGGSSTGTRGVDGRLEKINTLSIGTLVAEELEALGANVIVTRDCDADPGLHERAIIANRTGADLFVSIHCNDGGPNHVANGSIVFYHMQSDICRQLADAITARLRDEVGSIRSQRPRSDSAVYKNDGFAVLRLSQMAGVLVETGFMSNYSDAAALRNPETQRKIAKAVAGGVLDFVQANPDLDTKNVKPQPLRDDGLPLPEVDPNVPLPDPGKSNP